MPKCSVMGCFMNDEKIKKGNLKIKICRIPHKQPEIAKKWIQFCNRPEKKNWTSASVCTQHFTPDNFERSMMQVMLNYTPQTGRVLRIGAVPTINPAVVSAKRGRKKKNVSSLVLDEGNGDMNSIAVSSIKVGSQQSKFNDHQVVQTVMGRDSPLETKGNSKDSYLVKEEVKCCLIDVPIDRPNMNLTQSDATVIIKKQEFKDDKEVTNIIIERVSAIDTPISYIRAAEAPSETKEEPGLVFVEPINVPVSDVLSIELAEKSGSNVLMEDDENGIETQITVSDNVAQGTDHPSAKLDTEHINSKTDAIIHTAQIHDAVPRDWQSSEMPSNVFFETMKEGPLEEPSDVLKACHPRQESKGMPVPSKRGFQKKLVRRAMKRMSPTPLPLQDSPLVAHKQRKNRCAVCRVFSSRPLFPFPAGRELRKEWEARTGVLPFSLYEKTTSICSLHFEENQFHSNGRRLKRSALPTLFLRENTPVYPESIVPVKSVHKCCICLKDIHVISSIQAFDDNDNYTDFGVALSNILRMTSEAMPTRYCCRQCSEDVLSCFDSMVSLNASVLLAHRTLLKYTNDVNVLPPVKEKRVSLSEKLAKLKAKCDKGVEDDIPLSELKAVVEAEKNDKIHMNVKRGGRHYKVSIKNSESNSCDDLPNFNCHKCSEVLDDAKSFSSHLLRHLMEKKHVGRSDAMTQVHDNSFNIEEDKRNNKNGERGQIEDADAEVEATSVIKNDDDFEENCNESRGCDFEGYPENSADELDSQKSNESSDDSEDCARRKKRSKNGKKIKKKELKDHGKSKELPGICPICGKFIRCMPQHLKGHKSELNWTCKICGKQGKGGGYKAHVFQHNRPRQMCASCGQLIRNIERHKRKCKGGKPIKEFSDKCSVCLRVINKTRMPRHMEIHEMEKDIEENGPEAREKYYTKCGLCEKEVKKTWLEKHMIMSHGAPAPERNHGNKGKKRGPIKRSTKICPPTVCAQCGASFENGSLFKYHMTLAHNERLVGKDLKNPGKIARSRWTCAICKVEILGYTNMRAHAKREHDGAGINLPCEGCGKVFGRIASLHEHITRVHVKDYYRFHCKPCDKSFMTELKYLRHASSNKCRVNGYKRVRNRVQNSTGIIKRRKIERPNMFENSGPSRETNYLEHSSGSEMNVEEPQSFPIKVLESISKTNVQEVYGQFRAPPPMPDASSLRRVAAPLQGNYMMYYAKDEIPYMYHH